MQRAGLGCAWRSHCVGKSVAGRKEGRAQKLKGAEGKIKGQPDRGAEEKADRALNTEQVSAHRTTRSQAKVVADRARDACRKEQAAR